MGFFLAVGGAIVILAIVVTFLHFSGPAASP
jgi:hypothetical protein